MIEKSIIIPTHNDRECVFECIRGIVQNTNNYEIIFVLDAEVEFREELKQYGSVIETMEPFLFSHRVNMGLMAARGEYMFIFNDDTIPQPLWGEMMIRSYLEKGPGLVGARCQGGGCHNIDAHGTSGAAKITRHTINMFAAMVSRRVLDVVGFLDQRFVTYGGEDDDYGLRVRRHGFEAIIAESGEGLIGKVVHKKSLSFGMERIMNELNATREIFKNKWGAKMPTSLAEHWGDRERKPLSSPLISVLMPTRGHDEHVLAAIDSVLCQTYGKFELLVGVDGADQTKTMKVLESVDDPRVKIFHFSRGGSCVVRNGLFDRSRGEFIALMDSDDRMLPERLEKQLAAMTPEVDIVHSSFLLEDASGKKKETQVLPFNKHLLLSLQTCLAGGTFFMRRYVLSLDKFNESYARAFDFEFALRTYGKYKYKFLNVPLLIYSRHDGSHLSGNITSLNVHRKLIREYEKEKTEVCV